MNPIIPICDCILAIVLTLMRSSKLSVQLCIHMYSLLKVHIVSYVYVAIPIHTTKSAGVLQHS